MVFKGLLILGGWSVSYLLVLLVGTQSIPGAILTLLLLTVTSLAAQLGLMHDASHHCITISRWPNYLFRMTLTVMGGSAILWYQNHVVAHHSETNISGRDPDIDSFSTLRFHEGEVWHFWHRWQHWYALPLYASKALFWVWGSDLLALIGNPYKFHGRQRILFMLELLFSRASHILFFLVLPYWVVGSWAPVLVGYVSFMLLFGASMTLIFTLAHITDVQAFHSAGPKPKADWALHQVHTTSDFSVNNRLLTWFIGGLNYQIEHHIFPNISHLHYPKIQPLVKNYCKERGVPYYEYPSVWQATRGHFRQLRRLSVKPNPALTKNCT